jgi:hypothetical protein
MKSLNSEEAYKVRDVEKNGSSVLLVEIVRMILLKNKRTYSLLMNKS